MVGGVQIGVTTLRTSLMELNVHTCDDGAVRSLDVHVTEMWAHGKPKSCTRMFVAVIANSPKLKAQNAH